MRTLPFRQVDVFAGARFRGNPVAVVHHADALDDETMARFARWTNLSETTFLLRPSDPAADYRLRIFTPERELPFAGHPTLGSAHAWTEAGGVERGPDIVQQCGAGLVRVRREGAHLAFAAPPLLRAGPVEEALLATLARGLGIARDEIVASNWVDNGPGWVAVMLRQRDTLLALRPDASLLAGLDLGAVAPFDAARDGTEAAFEVRAFAFAAGVGEDPVTGSLNAGLAQWMIGAGLAPDSYVVSQGTAIGRVGRVHVRRAAGEIWVGGATSTLLLGEARF